MNRPKLDDFYTNAKSYKVNELLPIAVNYFRALEKYCDELEKQIEDGYPQHLAELCDIKDKKIEQLEIALDKMCILIAKRKEKSCFYCPIGTDNCVDLKNKWNGGCRASKWKEWSMKDE